MKEYFKGKIWLLGDNISVEDILPSKVLYKQDTLNEKDAMKFVFEDYYKDWYKYVKNGDIIVAGKNFGWGSSRPAPRILKKMGISCIVVESVSRLFFRNSIHIGVPIIICEDITKYLKNNEYIKADIVNGIVENEEKNIKIKGIGIPRNSPPYEIIKRGGIL